MLHKTSFYAPLALALATVATCTLSEVASAATFNLSYTTSTGTITATVEGTLQPDNNRVVVSSVSNPTFNGSPAPALPFINSYTSFIGGPPTLTLNGSGLDLYTCTDSECSDGFAFIPAGLLGPFAIFASGPAYGDIFESYDPANYSLTAVSSTPVPEPSAVVGLALVGGAFLWGKLRKAA